MTIKEIQRNVSKNGKKMSRAGIYKHIRALKLKPMGIARPAIYPDNSAEQILIRLGFNGGKR
jgi:hypothetical protein